MFWNKKKRETIVEAEHLDYTKTQSIIYSWFMNSVFTEARIIAENGFNPSTLYLKYPIKGTSDKELLIYIQTGFGRLHIIIDPDMKELLRVE